MRGVKSSNSHKVLRHLGLGGTGEPALIHSIIFNRLTAAHIRLITMQKKQPTQPAQPTKLVVAST